MQEDPGRNDPAELKGGAVFVPVEVTVQNFTELFGAPSLPLAVDTYQRGFVWNDDKIRQLAEDLADYEHEQMSGPKPPYYMGTVLLHRHSEKKKRFVIDGQQRLTALCVLHHQLTTALPTNCALTFSPESARRIRGAAELFRRDPRPHRGIFEQIVFTVIVVDRVDLAFTFFDTQNNRGVRLHATDLLKAYHLRSVENTTPERKETLQNLCAGRWEGIQQGAPVMSHDQEFAPSLFGKFLWRARYWTGSRVTPWDHDALMEEFQQNTSRSQGGYDNDTVPLYRSRHNRLGTALTLTLDGHSEIHTKHISLSPKAEDLPFAIRQPIQKGIGFFLYVDKYASVLRRLVVEPTDSTQVRRFREVYTALLLETSVYLREAFLLASLMYVDQFEEEKLWECALWLEHALGAIRIKKQQVRYEAVQNFFKYAELNLLDVIASAFRPEQVIDYLRQNHTHQDIYDEERIEAAAGVQADYKRAVLTYYGRPLASSLSGRHGWIELKLQEDAA